MTNLWIALAALVLVFVINTWTFLNIAASNYYLLQARRIRLGLPVEPRPWYVRLSERLP